MPVAPAGGVGSRIWSETDSGGKKKRKTCETLPKKYLKEKKKKGLCVCVSLKWYSAYLAILRP
jgi:hypothetical protein